MSNSLLNKILLEGLSEIVKKTIIMCAELYKFDANEAMSQIGIEDLMKMSEEVRNEEVRNEEVRKEEKKKEKKEKKEKTEIPMPYNGDINEDCCKGIKHNSGLYTQCKVKSKNGEKYCKMCENQASKHSHGKPTYGSIEDRLAVGIMDYVDPSGKKPEMYMNVLKKMSITINDALNEAKKQNIEINPIHLNEEQEKGIVEVEKVTEKTKGRPKKSKKVLEVVNNEEDDDLINTLLEEAKKKQSNEDDEEEKKKREQEESEKKKKEQEEQEKKKKDAKKLEKKKREQEEEEKKKKEQEEAEKKKREQEEEEEKKKKEQEEAEKKKKEQENKESGALVVRRITYKDGNTYLKSKAGLVYNQSQTLIGIWNETTGEIEFNKKSDEEELSEEEYEEDSSSDEEEEEEEED